MPLRVLIADDHRLFAEALRAILGGDRRIDVVGLAASGDEAVRKAKELEPDVILMDIRMPGMDGLEATRQILATQSDTRQDVDAARSAGAKGYVTKDKIAAELIGAILNTAA